MKTENDKLEQIINEKIHDPADREIVRGLIKIKLSQEEERKLIKKSKVSPDELERLEKMVNELYEKSIERPDKGEN
jgi:hypothetical protein